MNKHIFVFLHPGIAFRGQTVRHMVVQSSEGIGSRGTLWLVGGSVAFVGLGALVSTMMKMFTKKFSRCKTFCF